MAVTEGESNLAKEGTHGTEAGLGRDSHGSNIPNDNPRP
jgi:hypothetical protein